MGEKLTKESIDFILKIFKIAYLTELDFVASRGVLLKDEAEEVFDDAIPTFYKMLWMENK